MEETLPPTIDQFLQELRRQDLSQLTLVNYKADLVHFARWLKATIGEEFSPTVVTPTDVRAYRAFLITVERRSPATVNRRLASLRKYFLWAKAEKLIADSPTDSIKGVGVQQTAPKALDKRQVDKLLRAAQRDGDKRNLAILELLRSTGLRVAEACALRLDDIEIGERSGRVIVRSGKGSRHRVVPLNLDVRKALSAYLNIRPTVSNDALFVSRRGTQLTTRSVENIVSLYARIAGLDDVSPHVLRHTFGKQALDSGADLVTVSNLLGHRRLDTTAIYTQPSEHDKELAVQRLEADFIANTDRG
jgi:integrase/recombinase XerD